MCDEWPEEKLEVLKSMWARGLSAGSISYAVEATRSAVLGKIKRLGLTRKPSYERPITHKPPEQTGGVPVTWTEESLTERRRPRTPRRIDMGPTVAAARAAVEARRAS